MKKKKTLHLDGKKRVTLGKLISKDTTFFEVEKKADGTIILSPKSDLPDTEAWIYKNKKAFKSLKQGLKDVRKSLVTRIDDSFWGEDNGGTLNGFKFTKEFLQALEPIISKHDTKKLKLIKTVLQNISDNTVEKMGLNNLKTEENKTIFQTKTEEKMYIFWVEKEEEKIAISLMTGVM